MMLPVTTESQILGGKSCGETFGAAFIERRGEKCRKRRKMPKERKNFQA